MFLQQSLSETGRSSEQQLDALRRQLGVGIDPAYDYSQLAESHKKLAQKKERRARAAEEQDTGGPVSSLDQLRRALREVVGGGAAAIEEAEPEEADGVSPGSKGASASPAAVRARQEQQRPSAAFLRTSRERVARLDVDNPCRFRAPPVGIYRPKDDLCQPRLQNAGPGGDFGLREAGRSLKENNAAHDRLVKHAVSVELLERTPEKAKPRAPEWDLSRTCPRPDLVKSAGIVYNVNSFTAGVLEGDLACSQLTRNPSWDFAKISVAKPKSRETYFQPGQYRVNIGAVRARVDTKNIGFEKQRARKPLKEFVGRVEIDQRTGHHLPDRSLSRSSGMTMTRSMPLLSKEPRVQSPTFDKYTSRPSFINPAPEYHRSDDPEAERAVLQRGLAYDAAEAERPLRPRPRSVEHFSRSLRREQHFKIQRSYGEDLCLQRVKDNVTRGPVSVELLSDVDCSPSLQRRVTNLQDFGHMDGRKPEKRYVESPPRNREHAASRFERGIREGDARCEVAALSPLAAGLSELRATRAFEPQSPLSPQ